MENKISFKNQKGTILRGFVHEPKKYNTALIFCHGFPNSAIEESAARVSKTFEKLGYLTLRFSFSGTPPSDGKFEEKLMSQESREIKFAIDFLTKHYAFKKLVLFGHSTGAIDLALYAHKDKRITKVILGGAVSRLDEAVNRPKKLVIIKGADHSFSGKKHWNQVVKGIKTFVEKTT